MSTNVNSKHTEIDSEGAMVGGVKERVKDEDNESMSGFTVSLQKKTSTSDDQLVLALMMVCQTRKIHFVVS